ncbi:unnamed protein product, partial [Vitis vinifera]
MESKNRHNEHLGVNKIGKNIRKSPLHQPNFGNTARQQPQPQVYNISKNDFRNIVQQLTGSPSQEPLPRPPQNPPKHPSMRLQRIRPPPLSPINRPHIPPPALVPAPAPALAPAPGQVPYNHGLPLMPGDTSWTHVAESPISAYMRYLQNSIIDSGPRPPLGQGPPRLQSPVLGSVQAQPPVSGLIPNPHYPFPSPSGFLNLLSPRSPYPLLSPGYQFPPPLTPNFSFSPMAGSGILGPGPQPPPSPGIVFPLSPSGFFPLTSPSPRWRDP